jgi:hypothetical protein
MTVDLVKDIASRKGRHIHAQIVQVEKPTSEADDE